MSRFYICKCYVLPHVIERFEKYYSNYQHNYLQEFSLGLLISHDAKFPENLTEKTCVLKRENPYLVAVLSERLIGNLSHLLRYMDIEQVEVDTLENLMEISSC